MLKDDQLEFLKILRDNIVASSNDFMDMMIDEYNNEKTVKELLCKCVPTGDLASMLKCYDNFKYSEIINGYKVPQRKKATLPSKIIARFQTEVNNLYLHELDLLKDIASNGHTKKYNKGFINKGFIFGYLENDEIYFTMPTDLLEVFNSLYNSKLEEETIKRELDRCLNTFAYIYGAFSIDLFTKTFNQRFNRNYTVQDIMKYMNTEIYKTVTINNICHVYLKHLDISDLSWIKDDIVLLSENDEMKYAALIASILNLLSTATKENDEENVYKFIINDLLKEAKSVDEIMKMIDTKFGIKENERIYFRKNLESLLPRIRYFNLGGYSKRELDLDSLVLNEKPSDTKLVTILNILTANKVRVLNDKYYSKDNGLIAEKIMDSFEKQVPISLSSKKEALDILAMNNKEYTNHRFDKYLLAGYYYLYKDNDKVLFLIPKEIEDILTSLEDEDLNEFNNELMKNLTMLFNMQD